MIKPIKNPITEYQCQRIAKIANRFGNRLALKAFNQFIKNSPRIVFWEVLAMQDRIGYIVKQYK